MSYTIKLSNHKYINHYSNHSFHHPLLVLPEVFRHSRSDESREQFLERPSQSGPQTPIPLGVSEADILDPALRPRRGHSSPTTPPAVRRLSGGTALAWTLARHRWLITRRGWRPISSATNSFPDTMPSFKPHSVDGSTTVFFKSHKRLVPWNRSLFWSI